MKTIILLLAFLTASQAVFGEWFAPMTRNQKIAEAMYVLVTSIDWMQTKEFRSKGVKEINPILGAEPSQERVDTLIFAGIISHMFIACLLPQEYKNSWIGTFLVVESIAVMNNYRHGYGPNLEIKFYIHF